MNTRKDTHRRTIVGVVAVLVIVAGMGAGTVMAISGPGDDGTGPTVAQVDQAEENETTEPANETTGPPVEPTGPDLTRSGDHIVYTTPAGEAYGVDNLSVEATDEDGETLVTATVNNPNDWLAVQYVELRIDGDVQERMPVALDANESQNVSFMVDTSEWEAGDHKVAVLSHDYGAVTTVSAEEPAEEPQNTSLTFENQTSDGETVIIDEVTLSDGGFVAVHESTSLAEGEDVNSTVGVSEYLEAGTHENVTVTLFDDVDLDGEINMTAMAHLDTNENEEFDFVTSEGADDGPYVVDGEAVVDDAVVTVEMAPPTNETTTEEPTETTTEEPTETTTEEPTETTTEESTETTDETTTDETENGT
ncbi:MAG: DUF7282 domain-containing protein [archaeon]